MPKAKKAPAQVPVTIDDDEEEEPKASSEVGAGKKEEKEDDWDELLLQAKGKEGTPGASSKQAADPFEGTVC